MLSSLLRFMCLMISNFGYYNLLRKKTTLHISFLPIVTIGIQFVILFFAGLLNILLPVSIAMQFSGILLFVFDFLHKKYREYLSFASMPYAFMGISMLVMLYSLHGSVFFAFDDFSHWATVVQDMLLSNSYPNYRSTMLSFPTYPLGSATYIYYCCLIAGTEESTQMLIQAFMMICTMMPLFSCMEKHKYFAMGFLLLFENFMLTYNIGPETLRVDTLLPLFCMGTFLIAWTLYTSGGTMEETQNFKDIWALAPLLSMAVMIKDSGLFFLLPSLVVIAVMWKKSRNEKWKYAAVLFAPAAAIVLWRQHCRYVFDDPAMGKHAVSAENYARILNMKSMENIVDTGRDVFHYILNHPALWCILGMMLAILLVSCLLKKKDRKNAIIFSGLLFLMYLLYSVGLYAMYVFSMPQDETEELLEILRYISTMDLAAFYLIAAYVLHILDHEESNRKFTAEFLCVSAVLILLWGGLTNWHMVTEKEDKEPRAWFSKQIQQYNIPLGASCVIASGNKEASEFLYMIMRYLLWSPTVLQTKEIDENTIDVLQNFQYIIMFDYENDFVNQWVYENYPDQLQNRVIVVK